MRLFRKYFVVLGALILFGDVLAGFDEDYENKQQWRELEFELPAAPGIKTLQAFYVSAASDNKFLIDLATLAVGSDGVVRYVLLVLTPDGGRNVTFEGMRCESREARVYAFGRPDGAWSKARNIEWFRIKDVYANRHHAALFLEYFCPGGVIVRDAAEARGALLRGSHPDNRLW